MALNRRSFLRALVAIPFVKPALALLPEALQPKVVKAGLLFEPKYYTVSVPVYLEEIRADFFREDPFLKFIKDKQRKTINAAPIQENLEFHD